MLPLVRDIFSATTVSLSDETLAGDRSMLYQESGLAVSKDVAQNGLYNMSLSFQGKQLQ